MLIIFRFLKYLVALIIAVWLLFIVIKSQYFINGTILALICVWAASYWLINKKIKKRQTSFFYALLPLLIIASGIFYLLLVEVLLLKIIIIVGISFLWLLYLNEIYRGSFLSPLVPAAKQRQIFLAHVIIIIFFNASALLGISDFLSISISALILPFGLVIFLLTNYLIFPEDKIGINRTAAAAILAVLLMELFWAVSILPIVYYIKGLIISFFYLLMIQFLVINRVNESLKPIIRNYLIIILSLLIGLLSTSRWF